MHAGFIHPSKNIVKQVGKDFAKCIDNATQLLKGH